VILDLEGSAPSVAGPRRLWPVLSFGSAAVAAALLALANAFPHEQLARQVPASGPSVIEQELAKPSGRRRSGGGSAAPSPWPGGTPPHFLEPPYTSKKRGPARPAPTVRSYRLRGSNDLVVVALAPDAPIVYPPRDRAADALAVHGSYAVGWTVEPTLVSVVRWTENGMTYEISSRTLRPPDLAGLAGQLR